ncbi:fatty acid desaturase [Aquimarina sp. 2201CG14-23]|uniref:fatty acid desaturase n=1 Tax=Aquimarina mycalae TaxID=3040073 RepID=UPI002477D5C1|nr:fatty acid desaturase [Aquimarina sp. 2201CG14-23]MDH7444051.1 fatty acid desaturase [Aquimarina sp. 2201CG14-23]
MKNQAVWQKYSGKVAWPTISLFILLCIGYAVLWKFYTKGLSAGLTSLIGAVLAYGMFTIAHEASHNNISGGVKSYKGLEKILGWLSSFFLLFPFSAFVVIHLRHHAHTNDPIKDPDHYVNGNNPFSIFLRCVTLIGHYFILSLGVQSKTNPAMRIIRKQSILFLIILTGTLSILILSGNGKALFFVFILSALIAAPVLAFSFDWLPHYPHNNLSKYHNTRVVTIPGLEFLSLYQSYHLIHHLYPRVPFYKYRSCFLDIETELLEKQSVIEGFRSQDLKILDKQNTYNDIKLGKTWSYVLEVENVFQETEDTVRIVFKNLEGNHFQFKSGQYVVISDYVQDCLVSRCYSISEDPGTGKLAVGVKSVPGGKLSSHLVEKVKENYKLRVSGPFGKFVLPESIDRSFLFIAGGSGITPIISMVKFILRTSKERVTLLYGCRSSMDVIFSDELNELTKVYPEQFNYMLSFELLDSDRQYAYLMDTSINTYCYICGPTPMMEASKVVLDKIGVKDSFIRTEEFSKKPKQLSGNEYQINTLINNSNMVFKGDASETILNAAIRANKEVPYACMMGDCGTCKAKLVEGEVHWNSKKEIVLLEREIDQGYILTCTCVPKTDITITV